MMRIDPRRARRLHEAAKRFNPYEPGRCWTALAELTAALSDFVVHDLVPEPEPVGSGLMTAGEITWAYERSYTAHRARGSSAGQAEDGAVQFVAKEVRADFLANAKLHARCALLADGRELGPHIMIDELTKLLREAR